MASTYSSSLRIQLIETDTEFEAWGQPLDNNLGTVIEQAIVGSNTISLTNLTSLTLSTANAAVDQARNAVLVFDGALTANCNVIAPSVKKVYVVSNKTSGGYLVNIKTSSGNAVSVINGTNQLVYCDSTDFKTAVNINTIIGDLAVSGSATVNGSITIGKNISGPNNLASTNGNITTTSNTSIVQLGNNSGAAVLPTGNTAQRPSTVKLGMQRWNTELGWMELWNGIIWYPLTGSYGVQYLVVAGGGAGGGTGGNGGGGGAGGTLIGGTTVQAGTAYTITIGAGGASFANQGANTFALGFTTIGGGGGGNNAGGGGNGGSGGGAARGNDGIAKTGGSATSGQGFAGGSTDGSTGSAYGSAGGGGAGAVGANGQPSGGGTGGSGASSSITGTLAYYAGGGGGAGGDNVGSGGIGGGGSGGGGSVGGMPLAQPGTANTGGGGGGSGSGGTSGGSNNAGGSGIVILSYESPTQTATGGTVTSYSSGGDTYWVHTFTTSGTFTA
jgi:hypothetical protein